MQEKKIITKNWGKVNPSYLESYRINGGYAALHSLLRNFTPEKAIEEVKESGLVGRGGAGFPTGKKWEIAAGQKCKERFFVCNLDESEPGTFKDRAIAENDPHQVLEGVIIASYAVGAQKAFIYLNGGFAEAEYLLQRAIDEAYEKNILGKSILGSAFDLEAELFSGAGAYICGEESALINSLEGKRGEPRSRPPYPCECGLNAKPTVVNNAETISSLPFIFKKGAKKFKQIGLRDCPGTKMICLDGAVNKPGLYETPMGLSVEEIINQLGGGMKPGLKPLFVQIGGASGRLAIPSMWSEIPSYQKESRIPIGSGSVLVVDDFQDPRKIALSWMNFFQRESCGKCVPCREGTFRLKSMLERLVSGEFNGNDREDVEKLLWNLENTTFCALGKFAAAGLRDLMKYKLVEELKPLKKN